MEPMETATTVERQLLERARHTHTPINGSLELLPICNMNCDMCYVRLSREEVQALGGLHTADEWIAVGQQMKEAGVLFLLLTGGEPLLFPDFKRLYLELRSMGFIITINTNGTLVDEEWADFFGRNKPRRVNITLYGANEEEYSRLCHYPAGFEKTVRGIRLLRQAGVDVKISCSVTKVNQYSLKQIFALGDELDAPVHIDPGRNLHYKDGTCLELLRPGLMYRTNTSGVKGVYYSKTRGKWIAQIMFRNKCFYLGGFDTIEDAAQARREAEKQVFGDFLHWYEHK